LTRLALRYTLDARHPIKGDIGRFALRRIQDTWEVIEYPSVAMKAPSIPLPGRLVKDIFAVRILDYLQQQPPAIYALMGLIESLLGGVPADLMGSRNGSTDGQRAGIEVNLMKFIVWFGEDPVPVSEEQAHFVHLVVSAAGTWISSGEMGEAGESGVIIGRRPDRVYKKLPARIREVIESGGGRGYRLRMAWVTRPRQS